MMLFHGASCQHAPVMADYDLPTSYGWTRLVLLPVDPFRVHAYWEVVPQELHQAEKQTAGKAQAILRFYKAGNEANGNRLDDSFDVVVDLVSRNWYVDLWSTLESCYADLALKNPDGTLIRMARSQVIQLPRAQPTIEVQQHFKQQQFKKVEKVEAEAPTLAETVPPPARAEDPKESVAHLPAGELEAWPPPPKPVHSPKSVQEILTRVYRSLQRRRAKRFAAPKVGAAQETVPVDLTSMAEEKLATGISSGEFQGSSSDQGTEREK